jgi:hypothetical protein
MISLKLRHRSDRPFSLDYRTIDPTDFLPRSHARGDIAGLAGFVIISQFNDIENIPFILEGLTTGCSLLGTEISLPVCLIERGYR